MENDFKKPELNLMVEADGALILRQGDAAPIHEKKGVSYVGNISAPADWFELKIKNKLELELSDITVLVHNESIVFKASEFVPDEAIVITGMLHRNEDLKTFCINSSKQWSNKELASFLKMNRYFFADRDENLQIVKNLNSFKAKVSQEIESSNDFKGNKKHLFEQTVKAELKLNFQLTMPIFKGESNRTFDVEINFDISDGSVVYWLESADLRELELKDLETIMNTEVKRFKGITLIHSA